MTYFISNAELDEIAESLVIKYIGNGINDIQCVDIEGFIVEYLSLPLEYACMAEQDLDKLGFISDGKTELVISENGKRKSKLYPLNTIVIDKYLLGVKESGKRRFTLAHEVGHLLLINFMQMNLKHNFTENLIRITNIVLKNCVIE